MAEYTKPIPLEELPSTPSVVGEMLEEYNNTKKQVSREITVEGLGKGRLVMSQQNKFKPFFYADEANVAANQKAVKQTETLFTLANAPALLAPLFGIVTGGKAIMNQRLGNQIKKMSMSAKESDLSNAVNVLNNVVSRTKNPTQITSKASTSTPVKVNPYTVTSKTQRDILSQINTKIKSTTPITITSTGNVPVVLAKKDDDINKLYKESQDPKDIPRNDPGMWMTAGQQSKPLSIKFFEDAGWKGGRLNLKSWREAPGDGKAIAELFLTAQGKGVVFGTERNKQNAFMSRVFGIEGAKQLLELPENAKGIFQAHHATATKAVLTGQEGLVYDSPYYHEIQKVWEDLELTLGNNPKNIIGTLGLVQRDLNSPHSLIHKFLDSKMGKDGTDFWTPEIMNQIVVYDDAGNAIGHKNFDLRVAKTKEQALIFKEAVDLLKLAHRQFYLAKGVKPGEYLTTEPILDEEVVDSFINKLPPKGGTGKYTTNVIKRIAKEIADEPNVTPTVKPSIQDVFDKQTADLVDSLYKFAVNEANGEDMLLDVLFEGLTPRKAINKWRKNDPQMQQLSIRLKKAVNEAKTDKAAYKNLKQLYQSKQDEIPPADTAFDKGVD